LVINTVDEMMHGMVLGDKGMANQIDQWCSNGILKKILIKLLALGYQVFITADHGNVETSETIAVSDGILASAKGERVRIYTDESLIPQVENTRVWKSSGLPVNIFPVIALDEYSFKRSAGEVVVHGGASIQEVIVPFIEIGSANE
jgi:type III secretion system FlhB-like substrate exporter